MNIHDEQDERRTARLFRNGRSQAVRIPREFEFQGDQVFIARDESGRLTLEEVTKKPSLLKVLASLDPLPREDWMPEIRDYPPEPINLGDGDAK